MAKPQSEFRKQLVAHLKGLRHDEEGWRTLDVPVPELGQRIKGDKRFAQNLITTLVREQKLEVRRAGTGARSPIVAVRFTEADRPPLLDRVAGPATTKEVLLAYIQQHHNDRGFLTVSHDKMRRALSLPRHDFMKFLFDLRDEGLIALGVVGNGSSLRPVNIRLRPAGTVRKAGETVPEPSSANEEPTEPDSQGPGQPSPEPGESLAEDIGKAVVQIAEFSAAMKALEARWPMLFELFRRASHIGALNEAAELLDKAGFTDDAVDLLGKEQVLSPFEQEVFNYLTSSGFPNRDPGQVETASVRPVGGVSSSSTSESTQEE